MTADGFDIRTSVPNDNGEPVFAEPWEAQAFAMVVGLHEKGVFDWSEWAGFLSQEIHYGDAANSYYQHWLNAAEKIMIEKGAFSEDNLASRKSQWERAAHATPHGDPIRLENDPQSGARN